MSLESMKARLGYRGGAAQQDRMIKDKYKSMLSATKYSYQAARFSKYPNEDKTFPALFNRESVNMDSDTKVISTGFENNVHVGDILYWENDKSYWICYAQERSELAYFRGHCRKCDYKVEWIDKDRHKRESYMSVVGPTQPDFRTFNPGFGISVDTPTADLIVLVTDNDQNAAYFEQYQHFIIRGVTYKVHQVDYLSMPGVRQLFCKQDYSELIDDDVEENLVNKWNVQPVITEHETSFAIEGPQAIKPLFEYEFTACYEGGKWWVLEAADPVSHDKWVPVEFIESDHYLQTIHLKWNGLKSGHFTLCYEMPDGTLFKREIIVESLM